MALLINTNDSAITSPGADVSAFQNLLSGLYSVLGRHYRNILQQISLLDLRSNDQGCSSPLWECDFTI